MHRAWLIGEIRNEILNYLESQDLLSVAQTCKELFSPATDNIWKTIPSLVHFLVLLPGIRNRPVEQADIDRLDLYGSKVQSICIEGQPKRPILAPREYRPSEVFHAQERPDTLLPSARGTKVWDQIWAEIVHYRLRHGVEEFLPNLRRIRVHYAAEGSILPLIGITGSKLIDISIEKITHKHGASVIGRIFQGLGQLPHLKHLYVKDWSAFITERPDLFLSSSVKSLNLN